MNLLQKCSLACSLCLVLPGMMLGQQYKQTTLASNTPGVAPVTDTSLVNGWGISRASGGTWWVSDNSTGLSTLYNGQGAKESLVVKIPKADPKSTTFPAGSPTGTIFNGSTTDFLLAPGAPAAFLFSTLDGTIAGWNASVGIAPGAAAPSTNAVTVVKMTDGSSYTGLSSALVHGERFLYAANFSKGRIDVFDNAFHSVSAQQLASRDQSARSVVLAQRGLFTDDLLPKDFAPFNVQAIGNDLVVTYAEQPANGVGPEVDGPGLGYVDIFSASGRLLRRLEHGAWLNAPWGVALAPLDFGRFSHDLLVAQFGGGGTSESAGYVAAYDLATGRLDGILENASGLPLVIQGVWSLSPGNVAPNNLDATASPAGQIYFAGGPDGGKSGVFGYISPTATSLVEGNDQ